MKAALKALGTWLLLAALACAPAADRPVEQPSIPVAAGPEPAASLEDPPYALDSVFKPEDHRSAELPLPADVVLLDQILEAGELFEANAHLGESVAIAGNLAVAGAPYADSGSKVDAGAVGVFVRENRKWSRVTKLQALRPFSFDRFGSSVAVSGRTLVVGADRHDQFAPEGGAAYVFELTGRGWEQGAPLAPRALKASACLGYSAALDGTTLLLGAPGSSSVFVFSRRQGTFQEAAELKPAQFSAHDGFGHAVGLAGDIAVVGANTDSGRQLLAGSAWVFRRDGGEWRIEAELRSPREEALARFGTAVAVRGDRILIGASRATVGSSHRAGAAFLFERRGGHWVAIAELASQPPRSDEELARAVALLPHAAVVGSHFSDSAGLNTGGALLFAPSGEHWVRRATVLARDRATISELAFALAAGERDVIMGAPRRSSGVTANGGVYLWSISP